MVRVEAELLNLLEKLALSQTQKGVSSEGSNFLEVFSKLFLQEFGKGELSNGETPAEGTSIQAEKRGSPFPTTDVGKFISLVFFQNVQFPANTNPVEKTEQSQPKKEIPVKALQAEGKFIGNKLPKNLPLILLTTLKKGVSEQDLIVLNGVPESGETATAKVSKVKVPISPLLKEAYEAPKILGKEGSLTGKQTHGKATDFLEVVFPVEFKYAKDVVKNESMKSLTEKFNAGNINTDVYRELTDIKKVHKETAKKNSQKVENPERAYTIQISSLPNKVKEVQRKEGILPVIREAVFREEGKIKKASVKLDNLNLEVKLVQNKVDIRFSVPHGKENLLGFFDYIKISQILNSMGFRVEGFSVNGQEFNRQRLREREKDNINLNEQAQADRNYLNSHSSFSIAL